MLSYLCLQETLVDDHTCVLVLPPALGDKGEESLLAALCPSHSCPQFGGFPISFQDLLAARADDQCHPNGLTGSKWAEELKNGDNLDHLLA